MSDYTLYLISFSLTLLRLTVGQDGSRIRLTFTPKNPSVNTEVKIACQSPYKNSERMAVFFDTNKFAWHIKTQQIESKIDGWRKKEEVDAKMDVRTQTLSLKFKAKMEDSIVYSCLAIDAMNSMNMDQTNAKLEVIHPPIVTSLEVIPNPSEKKIIPGEKRIVKCKVRQPPFKKMVVDFTAPGKGSTKKNRTSESETKWKEKEYTLDRIFDFKDNGRTIFCSATNSAGTASKTLVLNITYATRNTVLSVSKGANISVGDGISCKSEGNPVPNVQITVNGYSNKDTSWASEGASGIGNAYLFIPHNATLGRYTIACNASNVFKTEVAKAVAINVVDLPESQKMTLYHLPESQKMTLYHLPESQKMTLYHLPESQKMTLYHLPESQKMTLYHLPESQKMTLYPPRVTVKPNEAASYASAGVIGGIILGLIVLVILVAIICFVVQRRQNETAKQESSRNEYQPVSTKPSEQQGAAELEKDTGPYDIDAHDNKMTMPIYKSGSQGGAHPGDRNQQATDLFVPSSGGSNGKQQFIERGDEGIDDETALNEQPLTYASLEFDETPRSRYPIVFKDSEKVEYSEIMSAPTYNNTYDDEHFYENVRHHDV